MMSENIPKTAKGFTKNTKDRLKNGLRPGASVGLISGIAQIVDTVENENVEPFADASVLNRRAGTCRGMMNVGKTAYANTSFFDAKTGVGGIVGCGVSALSASAHAEYGLNNSVGANATLVRAQANLGPVNAGKHTKQINNYPRVIFKPTDSF